METRSVDPVTESAEDSHADPDTIRRAITSHATASVLKKKAYYRTMPLVESSAQLGG